MNPTYRVEAFIVPISNRNDKNNDNIIDDVKVANKLKNVIELSNEIEWTDNDNDNDNNCINTDDTSVNIKSCNINSINCLPIIKIDHVNSEDDDKVYDDNNENNNKQNDKLIMDKNKRQIADKNIDIDNSIYDVTYSLLNDNKMESVRLRERFETAEYVTMKLIPKDNVKFERALIRTSSLMSIDERGETPDDCNDEFCCHGYKNGCTTVIQRPEAVTEEIFEINWMKRLEQLRAKESIINDKETVLFDRERLLFKKERELRILERLIKDKLKHAELYLKRCKSQNNDIIDCDVASKFSEQTKDSQSSKDNGTIERLSSIESLELRHNINGDVINNKQLNGELITRQVSKSSGSLNKKVNLSSERILKNPPNSRSSLVTNANEQYQIPKSDTVSSASSSYITSRNTMTGMSGYSSLRVKKRPKITYDDLDSTLSADIGDSSFIMTSKKFDPEIFKKPYAFTRSCSERRRSKIITDRQTQMPPSTSLSATNNGVIHNIEDDKLLKRISDNILISHDKNTKFQHYGLIDTGTNENNDGNIINDNKRHSYLDLEDGKKNKNNYFKCNIKKINNNERPISWNEETNEWLQKKRQAYNLQTAKKILTDDICYNKENHDSQSKLNQAHKKVSKGLKFNIFR